MKWTEMEILNDPQGQPYIVLSGEVKARAENMGIRRFLISLSHTRDYALCQLLALKT
jgi:holo-[acyl-carrier protein] synthase